MPNVGIPDLPPVSTLTGTELIPLDQGGVTRRATGADLGRLSRGAGPLADRPSAASVGAGFLYTATDEATPVPYLSDGSAWLNLVEPSQAVESLGAAGQMLGTEQIVMLQAGIPALGTALLPSSAWAVAAALPGKPDLFVGTGGHGHTFPGPSLPFGMAQLGPDTNNVGWDACSGYHRDDGSIMGFSHTHLSGTGVGDMLDVLVVPARGPLKLEPGPVEHPEQGYRQRYSDERAEPGYYRVRLESGVLAELTVTERTGLHRYSFPKGPGHILIDFAHCQREKPDEPIRIDNAMLRLEEDGTLTGTRQVFRWAAGRFIHFAMQLSRKPSRVEFFAGAYLGGLVGERHAFSLFSIARTIG